MSCSLSSAASAFTLLSERVTPYTICPARTNACAAGRPMKPDALDAMTSVRNCALSLRTAYPMMSTFMFSECGYTSQRTARIKYMTSRGFSGNPRPYEHENYILLIVSISASKVKHREPSA